MNLDFGSRIKELRQGKKMSQSELANKLHISNSMVSSYESGAKQPSVEILAKIAMIFQVSMDFMYGFVNENNSNTVHRKNFNQDYNFDYIDASGLMESQRAAIVILVNEFKETNSIGIDDKEYVDTYDYYGKNKMEQNIK